MIFNEFKIPCFGGFLAIFSHFWPNFSFFSTIFQKKLSKNPLTSSIRFFFEFFSRFGVQRRQDPVLGRFWSREVDLIISLKLGSKHPKIGTTYPRPIFLAKLKGMGLNCALEKWLATKVDICDFLLCLHFEILDPFLLKRKLRLKIDLST